MSVYSEVPAAMYDHVFFRLSPDAQRLEWFIRSAPERASEGLSRFRWGALEDAIGMSREVAQRAFSELSAAGRPFLYDAEAGVMFDKDALKFSTLGRKDQTAPWKGPDNRIKGALGRLRALPPTKLLETLYVWAGRFAPDFALAMREEFDFPEPDTDDYIALEDGTAFGLETPSKIPNQSVSKGLTKGRVEQSSDEMSRESGPNDLAVVPMESLSADLMPIDGLAEQAQWVRNWNASVDNREP